MAKKTVLTNQSSGRLTAAADFRARGPTGGIVTVSPSLFIGSSSEGLDAARAAAVQLSDDAEVTVWNEGVFAKGLANIESLVDALERFDFAAIVLTPDDQITIGQLSWFSPRDNVMFELGLFMGRLGRSRTFILCSTASLKVPSDLGGVAFSRFDPNRSDGNLLAALGPACFPIRETIRKLGRAQPLGTLPSGPPSELWADRKGRFQGDLTPLSSTQAKILQILADAPSSFHQVRRELIDRFASDTRPSVVQGKLQELVSTSLVVLDSIKSEYRIGPHGLALVRGVEAP